jgi:heat shock protein HtpX
MLQDQSGVVAFIVVLGMALTPAALRWWWGRPLARLADDPLIAEKLASHNQRVGVALGTCVALLLIGWPVWTLWAVPLLIVMSMAASHPLSRALFGETWSVFASISFYVRLILAVFGFWLLLAASAWLVHRAGERGWMAGALLAAILFAWDRYYADVLRRLLRTEPIEDPLLHQRFDRLVAATAIPAPRFECVAMRGGVLANALALPSLRQSSVIFTDTLLTRLTADEIVAICAHELAHLEYYDRTRLRRLQRTNWLIIALVCSIGPVSKALFGDSLLSVFAGLLCTAVITLALVMRARHRQRNETASDARAVELTGDPAALAGALAALHTIARVPRRWDRQREQQSTHPSLARRIRDIYAAAGAASSGGIAQPATFLAAAGEVVVTFDNAYLQWQESPGTTHLLDYATLTELRLHAPTSGADCLVAVDRQGRRWTMPIRPGDAAALQTALDAVDGRLIDHVQLTVVSAPMARLVAIFGCLLATMLGQIALALVALLAVVAPGGAELMAAGGGTMVAAALALRNGSDPAYALILALVGLAFIGMAYARRREKPRATRVAIASLATLAVLLTCGIALGGFDPIRLHQGARTLPAATIVLVALAGGCWMLRSRPRFRVASLAAALTGAATVALGSTVFLDTVGRDPFLVAASALRWSRLDVPAIASFEIPFEIDSMRLSPRGRLAAIVPAPPADVHSPRGPRPFYLRRSDGTSETLDVADLVFIDDRSALLLTLSDNAATVVAKAFDGSSAPDWQARVPNVHSGALAYSSGDRRWILTGNDEHGHIVRATGVVGQTAFERMAWKGPEDRHSWIDAVATRGKAALLVEKRYDYGLLGAAMVIRMPIALIHTYAESRLWRLGPGTQMAAGRSLFDVGCLGEAMSDSRLLCAAFDGTRTRILAVEPDGGAVSPIGVIDGRFYADAVSSRGWLTGWSNGRPTAIRLDTREAFTVPRQEDPFVNLVAPAEYVIGTAAMTDGGARVRLYPLTARTGTMTRAE